MGHSCSTTVDPSYALSSLRSSLACSSTAACDSLPQPAEKFDQNTPLPPLDPEIHQQPRSHKPRVPHKSSPALPKADGPTQPPPKNSPPASPVSSPTTANAAPHAVSTTPNQREVGWLRREANRYPPAHSTGTKTKTKTSAYAARSKAAICLNNSTKFPDRCNGSNCRYTASTFTATRPNSPRLR